MKKIILLVLSFALLVGCFAGCGAAQAADRIDIVCTIFPVYDWMRELTAGSENIELTLIADNGVDMHSYQPTTGDIVDISTCDIFVYVGGESDEWVEEVIARSGNEDMIVVNLLEALEGRVLETDGGDHHDHHGHDHEHHCVPDEHIWLSPVNADILCGRLCEELCVADEENAEKYESNLAAYAERLSALDSGYELAAQSGSADTLLFADRFPFRYLVSDYGLKYYAAFDGCSAETEASFETVAALAAALDEERLGCVLIIEGSEDRLARTVIDSSQSGGQQILTLDSMQSVTAEEIEDGATYIGIMEANLEVIRQALGG